MLLGILNFIPDDEVAVSLVDQLLAAVPAGSFLTISHPTTEINGDVIIEALRLWNEGPAAKMVLRSRAELLPLFHGVELLDPGVVTCPHWRPDPATDHVMVEVPHYGGVGRNGLMPRGRYAALPAQSAPPPRHDLPERERPVRLSPESNILVTGTANAPARDDPQVDWTGWS